MSVFYKIDLSRLCNHKIIYDERTEKTGDIGLEGEYIACNDLKFKEHATLNGVEFDFSFGEKDNVVCDGQHIEVGVQADTLHIIGFAYWGDTFDIFKVRYHDGTTANVKVPFVDWAHKVSDYYLDVAWLGDNIKAACYMMASGGGGHMACLHHATIALNGQKTVQEIVLPENYFLHVMAITLEKNK